MSESRFTKRRFIAGAVCPQCRALDRLVLESCGDGLEQQRRCVACGFNETMEGTGGPPAIVPRARFERSQAAPVDQQVVRILDPSAIRSPTIKKGS